MLGLKLFSSDPRNSPRFNNANLQAREILARKYGMNHEFAVYLEHCIGICHTLATYNAKACTSAPLKLFRMVRKSDRGKLSRLQARSISKSFSGEIKRGVHGQKIMNYAEAGTEMVEVIDHPIIDLLQSPNPILPGTLLEHLKWYMCWVGGNHYEYKSKNDGRPFMLSPMMGQYVNIEASVENGIERYAYGRSGKASQFFETDEVIHYKLYPSPYSALYGIGAMFGILPQADLIKDNLIHDVSMAKNGMHPDGIWMLPESTDKEEAKKFEKAIGSKFRGAMNRWKHLVFAGKVDFVSPQFPEKDLMSLPKLEHAERTIRQGFGHTESMADSTDTNVASAIQSYDKQFLGDTIYPALLNDAAFKNDNLLRDFGLDPDDYCFMYENPVVRDETAMSDRLRNNVQAGIITRNEARAELGLKEIKDDEMADKLLNNGVPLGSPDPASDPFAGLFGGSQTAPKPEEGGGGDDAPDVPEVPEGEIEEPEQATESKSVVSIQAFLKNYRDPHPWSGDCSCCSTKSNDPEDMAPDKILRDAMDTYASDIESVMADLLGDSMAEFVQLFAGAGIAANASSLSTQLAEQAQRVLMDAMAPVVEFGGTQQYAQVSGTFDIVDERAAQFIRNYTVELADDIMETTADLAKRAVQAGLEQGLGEDEITSAIQESGISENRARMIARTETQRAVQNGKRQAMLQQGIKEVIWFNAPGAREGHVIIASRSPKPIDEPFVKAGETIAGVTYKRDVFAPPADPNCRCGIRAVFSED